MIFLVSVAQRIDALNENIGKAVAWLTLLMVIVQFIVVIMRYVFGIGSIFMQESIIYLHATVFMLGAGYTLLHNGHVRVDIFYREASPRRKAMVDIVGVAIFLIPVCALIWWGSWPYVANSWRVFEGSRETSGIQAVFLLKTVILVFVVLVVLQGISMAIRSLLTLAGVEQQQADEPPEQD